MDKKLIKEKKLNKYRVSFDIILRKPSSERFSKDLEGNVVHKKDVFYASNEQALLNKVRLTYNTCGKVRNVNILN